MDLITYVSLISSSDQTSLFSNPVCTTMKPPTTGIASGLAS